MSDGDETSLSDSRSREIFTGDEFDVDLEGVVDTDFAFSIGIDSYRQLRFGRALTIRIPSLISDLRATQTFLPSSHLDKADENLYDNNKPVTTRQLHYRGRLLGLPILSTPTIAAPSLLNLDGEIQSLLQPCTSA